MGYSTWTLQTDTTVDEYLRQTFGPGIEAYETRWRRNLRRRDFEDDRTVFAVVILPHQAPCTRRMGRSSTLAARQSQTRASEDMGPYYYNCPRRIFHRNAHALVGMDYQPLLGAEMARSCRRTTWNQEETTV